ncbi:Odorant receptor 141 [Nylanderia fulva]|uniref:Odorant receptor n=1 Tax=Nylanderia fulva TaxID=613905 RepID=A0A6G1LPY2_9HYME|nr:odorant receptor 13a-like [Nylanderia fulva]KAF3054530.1 Odorant receptor 141 [Nylanderia fulva]
MSSNKQYQEDMMFITQFTRNILSVLGVWPSSSKERTLIKRIHKYLLIFISNILLYAVLLPGFLFWLFEKRTHVKIQVLPLLIFGYMAISKYGYLVFYQRQIKRCLKHIEEDWRNANVSSRNMMIDSAKTGRRLVALCGAFMYSSGLSFRLILPFAKGKIVNAQNVTIRPLPCPGYYFFLNTQASPTYEVVFAVQFLSGLVTFSITTGVCGLAAICVMHACGQLKILINLMKHLVEEQRQEKHEVDKKLAAIVEHQMRIRNFLQLVENTMQQMCLIELTGCTTIVCILGYCIIVEWEKSNTIATCSYFMSVTSMMINMFLFCYTGEQLTAQAEKVAIKSCDLEWYRLPNKKARGIVLVMIISNLPTKITAGKLMDLSFKTYGDVVKTAVTYFNMLRNFVE